jgi:peptide/nickel transport system substrate-binding protein
LSFDRDRRAAHQWEMWRTTRRRLLTAGVLSGGALALGGRPMKFLRQSAAAQAQPIPGGMLTLSAPKADIDEGFDPINNFANALSSWLHVHVYDRLLRVNPTTLALEPALAAAWETSADGLTYTFHLRETAFHDGSPVTADDVLFSFERGQTGPFWSAVFPSMTIAAPDPKTVIVTLERPWAPLPTDLAMLTWASILPKKAVEEQKQLFFQQPIGSGPFKFESWEPRERVNLAKHAGYWDAGKPYLDEVEFVIIAGPQEPFAQFEGGALDVLVGVESDRVDALRADPGVVVVEDASFGLEALLFNVRRAPFNDKTLRQAVSHAIDKNELIAKTYGGVGDPATTYLPPTVAGHDAAATGRPFDLGQARALVAQSSGKDGFAVEVLVIPPDIEPISYLRFQIVAEQLAKIGGTVKLIEVAPEDFRARQETGAWDLFYLDSGTATNEPDEISRYWVLSEFAAAGIAGYSNAHADELLDLAATATDQAQRIDIYKQLQTIITEDAPYVPIIYPHWLSATKPTVKDFHIFGNGSVQLLETWRDDA